MGTRQDGVSTTIIVLDKTQNNVSITCWESKSDTVSSGCAIGNSLSSKNSGIDSVIQFANKLTISSDGEEREITSSVYTAVTRVIPNEVTGADNRLGS